MNDPTHPNHSGADLGLYLAATPFLDARRAVARLLAASAILDRTT